MQPTEMVGWPCVKMCMLDLVILSPSHSYKERKPDVPKVEVSTPCHPPSGGPASLGCCALLSPSVCRALGEKTGRGLEKRPPLP